MNRINKYISLTRFVSGSDGLLVIRLDNVPLATEKESRLLLFQDMDSELESLNCSERISKAQHASKKRHYTTELL